MGPRVSGRMVQRKTIPDFVALKLEIASDSKAASSQHLAKDVGLAEKSHLKTRSRSTFASLFLISCSLPCSLLKHCRQSDFCGFSWAPIAGANQGVVRCVFVEGCPSEPTRSVFYFLMFFLPLAGNEIAEDHWRSHQFNAIGCYPKRVSLERVVQTRSSGFSHWGSGRHDGKGDGARRRLHLFLRMSAPYIQPADFIRIHRSWSRKNAA